ncbi:O-antigen ligase family protein [Haladaptatus sp. CMSO5]|uniref:O-antigen ligase family protein n=1 Tax=Haladaptatus sp. CMSO5 TaxID=3120514 RepID=UPI002FCE317E
MSSLSLRPSRKPEIRSCVLDILYLMFLFIGVVDSGPPLSKLPIDVTIIVGVILGLGMALTFASQSRIVFSQKSIFAQVLLFTLLGWLAMTLFWAPSNIAASAMLRAIIGVSVAFVYPIWMIGPDRDRLVRVLWFIAGFGVFLALAYGIYGYVPGIVPNRISLSRPIGLAAVILTVMAVGKKGRTSVVWGILALLLFIVLFQTGARGPTGASIIASCIAGVGMYLSRGEDRFPKQILEKVVLAISGIILMIPILTYQIESFPTMRRFSLLLEGGGPSLNNRVDFYTWSIKSWLSSPLSAVIGNGMGAFAESYSNASWYAYPHNIFVELAHGGGLVALVLFITFLTFVVRGSTSPPALKRPEHVTILGLATYMMINAQFSGDIYINKYLFSILGLLAVSSEMDRAI